MTGEMIYSLLMRTILGCLIEKNIFESHQKDNCRVIGQLRLQFHFTTTKKEAAAIHN